MLDFVKHNQWFGLLLLVLLAGLSGCGAQQPLEEPASKTGPAKQENRQFFQELVLPTLERNCSGCHVDRFRFVNYESSLKWIKPGVPDQSPILLAPLGQWEIPGGQTHIKMFWVSPSFYQDLEDWILAEQ